MDFESILNSVSSHSGTILTTSSDRDVGTSQYGSAELIAADPRLGEVRDGKYRNNHSFL